MNVLTTIYSGQDIAIQIDLRTQNFADVNDVIVDVYNNGIKAITLSKSDMLPVDGFEKKALVPITASQMNGFVDGYVHMAVTVVSEADGFPSGRKDKHYGTIALYKNLP